MPARSPISSRKYGDNIAAIKLDVTDKKAVDAAIAEAHKRFGRLDVVINNAGYGHFGAIEEVSEQEARDQIETNVFGALWVTQAALPIMRAQRSGHIIQISSIGGVNAFASLGLYHASKWALEAFSQSLSIEVAEFGIHVTLVEPGGFSTDWSGPSAKVSKPIEAYAPARAKMAERRASSVARRPRGHRTGDAGNRRRRRAAAARLLRRWRPADDQAGIRQPHRALGKVGPRLRSGAGREEEPQGGLNALKLGCVAWRRSRSLSQSYAR